MHRLSLFALALLVLASAARTGRADIIELADGSVQEGEVIHEDKNTITLSIQLGAMKGTVVLNRKDIRSVKVTEPVTNPDIAEGAALVKAAEALTDVKQAIAAWTKAAEFYDKHAGFSSDAHSAFEKVLLLDPDNAAIRARMGYVQTPDGWAKKLDLQRAEEAKLADRARAIQAKAKADDDDIVIGLREDNALVKKIAEEKARAKADPPPPPPQPAQQPQPQFANVNQGGIEYYQGLPYYPTILYGFGPGGFGGNGFGFGGGGFGYNNYGYGGGYGSGYGYSNYSSNYGSGLSLGFRGKIGSVRVNGRFGF